MPLTRRAALALAFLATLGGPVSAEEIRAGDLVITGQWTRATPPGAPAGGGFLTIENRGAAADRLVSASSAVAGKVEIHEMAVTNGVMTMRALAGGLTIPPGSKVELKPGGNHVMFIGLKSAFQAGQPVEATLVFERTGAVKVSFPVQPIGSTAGPGHQHGN